jgi:hypothetical protein
MSVTGRPPTAAQSNAPLLHRFLGIGLMVTAAALVMARHAGALGDPPENDLRVVGYALAGVSVILATVALMVVKPRVPERRVGQPVAQYWSQPDVSSRAMLVWFVLEGAGIVASIGYFLAGVPVAAGMMVLAIAAFWFTGPNVFAKE